VWSWGTASTGALGNGTDCDCVQTSPVQLTGVTTSTQVSGSTALLADGTVVAWGYNGHGHLGQGSNQPPVAYVPMAIPGLTGVTRLSGDRALVP